jgi:hypothetical protein
MAPTANAGGGEAGGRQCRLPRLSRALLRRRRARFLVGRPVQPPRRAAPAEGRAAISLSLLRRGESSQPGGRGGDKLTFAADGGAGGGGGAGISTLWADTTCACSSGSTSRRHARVTPPCSRTARTSSDAPRARARARLARETLRMQLSLVLSPPTSSRCPYASTYRTVVLLWRFSRQAGALSLSVR